MTDGGGPPEYLKPPCQNIKEASVRAKGGRTHVNQDERDEYSYEFSVFDEDEVVDRGIRRQVGQVHGRLVVQVLS